MQHIPIPNTEAFLYVLANGRISYHHPNCMGNRYPETLDDVPREWAGLFEDLIDDQHLNIINVQTQHDSYDILLNQNTQLSHQIKQSLTRSEPCQPTVYH